MFLGRFVSRFAKVKAKGTHLSAHKYIKSVTETALLYRPDKMVSLLHAENIKDRVVQTFFDSSTFYIGVSEVADRLTDVSSFSTPSHSFYQINLPFENNLTLRNKMTQFSSSNIRVGRLLELMDYIAANVAYRYCTPESDKDLTMDQIEFMVVTAAIDEIEFYYPISNKVDCLLSGYVSHVGNSSMEVHIDVLQQVAGEERLACSANFVMVARNKQTAKSHTVPKLSLENQTEKFKIITELGQQRLEVRKSEAKRGLEIAPPTYEESIVVYKLMKEIEGGASNYRTICSTTVHNTMLMHVEDKNLSGKIFGGLILRYGYEVAWLCASKHLSSALPVVSEVDEVQFLAPIEIGSYIELTADIGYINNKFMHIIVKCHNSSLSGQTVLTNILHITFQHSDGHSIPRVYPQSLPESYIYIEALRRVNKLTHF